MSQYVEIKVHNEAINPALVTRIRRNWFGVAEVYLVGQTKPIYSDWSYKETVKKLMGGK